MYLENTLHCLLATFFSLWFTHSVWILSYLFSYNRHYSYFICYYYQIIMIRFNYYMKKKSFGLFPHSRSSRTTNIFHDKNIFIMLLRLGQGKVRIAAHGSATQGLNPHNWTIIRLKRTYPLFEGLSVVKIKIKIEHINLWVMIKILKIKSINTMNNYIVMKQRIIIVYLWHIHNLMNIFCQIQGGVSFFR